MRRAAPWACPGHPRRRSTSEERAVDDLATGSTGAAARGASACPSTAECQTHDHVVACHRGAGGATGSARLGYGSVRRRIDGSRRLRARRQRPRPRAAVEGAVDAARQSALTSLHHDLDDGSASKIKLGCVYVDGAHLLDSRVRHPTWTHGALVQRILSGVARAELVRHEYAVVGELLTETRTIEHAAAPTWLIDQLRARRHGGRVTSPRVRTALIALSDARRTIASARCRPMPSQ